MLDVFQKHGQKEIDTARVYGGGSSEEYLGNLNWQDRGLIMGTKYYAYRGRVPGASSTHSASDLRKYLLESLAALKAKKIDLWYLHAPDRTTPFEETFRAVDDLYKEGYFSRFGLSNYMSWEIAYINELCIKNDWIRPTIYQGVYNAIHRTVDTELFPCLRHYGMAFYVFSPLAGGYLTNRYHRSTSEIEEGSRFDANTTQGKSYRTRYWNSTMFDALDVIREAAGKHGLTEAECALRWLMHHSKLSVESGDKVIIGASSAGHLEGNLVDFEKGPLPEDVVAALDEAWRMTKGLAYNYYH
jgi:aflatoxin B1 aldehyde reductase